MDSVSNFLIHAVDDTRYRALFAIVCGLTALVSVGFYVDAQNRRPSPILSVEVLPAKPYELPSLRGAFAPPVRAVTAKPKVARPAAAPLQVAAR